MANVIPQALELNGFSRRPPTTDKFRLESQEVFYLLQGPWMWLLEANNGVDLGI
jgi:hypothetical protein